MEQLIALETNTLQTFIDNPVSITTENIPLQIAVASHPDTPPRNLLEILANSDTPEVNEYHVSQSNAGRPPKLDRAEQLLVALQYWREYRSYFHIAQDWNVSEATVCRIVHRVETVLMNSGRWPILGKKQLVRGFGNPDLILIDVTETPIERPKKGQKQ